MIRPVYRSLWLLAGLLATTLMLVVSVLALVSARNVQRFHPVHRHATELQRLRRAQDDLMRSLLTHSEGGSEAQRELEEARAEIEQFLLNRGYLVSANEDRLRALSADLDPTRASAPAKLQAAGEIAAVLSDEVAAHDVLLASMEEDTRVELMLSAGLVVALPLIASLLVFALRHRVLLPLGNLRELMNALGQQGFRTVPTTGLDPLLRPVFENYNQMAGRLLELEERHRSRQETLEGEVRAATSALLHQQREHARSERLAAIGELAAGMAHELRNPLAGAQIALSGIRAELQDPEHASRLDAVVQELTRVTGLVKGVLDAARPNPEPMKLVRLGDLVADFERLARYQLPEHIGLRTRVPGDIQYRLPEGGLRQALWNLVINAMQAIDRREGEIVIEAERTADSIRLRVLDNGPGFPPQLLATGVRSFATLRAGGTGLGLATTRRFIQDLGGTLRIENLRPHGAAVNLDFPCESDRG